MRTLSFAITFFTILCGALLFQTVMGAPTVVRLEQTIPGGTLPPTPSATTTPHNGGTIPATPTLTATPTKIPGGTVPTVSPPATLTATPTDDPGGTIPTTFPPLPTETATAISTATPQAIDQVLSLTIATDRAFIAPGGQLVFTLVIANSAGSPVENVQIGVTVPHYTTYDAAHSSPGWELAQGVRTSVAAPCVDSSAAGTLCTNTIAQIAAGQSAQRDFAVTIAQDIPIFIKTVHLDVSLNGESLGGVLNQGVEVTIDPRTRLVLPLILNH